MRCIGGHDGAHDALSGACKSIMRQFTGRREAEGTCGRRSQRTVDTQWAIYPPDDDTHRWRPYVRLGETE